MVLKLQRRTPPDPNSFPVTQLFILGIASNHQYRGPAKALKVIADRATLALCRVAEPIALTSIFPYSWVMVKDFNIGDKANASFYAGVLISAFALAESLTGMFWGGVSDRIGRKPVLLLGCAGTLLSLLIVGFAQSFWVALAGRALGGLLNGNIGVIQTMVGELVKKPEHERKYIAPVDTSKSTSLT